MKIFNITTALLLGLCSLSASAQLTLDNDARKHNAIAVDRSEVIAPQGAGSAFINVMSSAGYTVSTDDNASVPMFTVTPLTDNLLRLDFGFNYLSDTRTVNLVLTAPDGTVRRVPVVREPDSASAAELVPYFKIAIKSASATAFQTGEGIERTYDGNYSTLWHSPYNGTSFPIHLTYTLTPNQDGSGPHVDRIIYTPRQDGNRNGNFGEIEVKYATVDAPTRFVSVCTKDLEYSGTASTIILPDGGLDNVSKIRITVNSGGNNFAACAEMEFQAMNSDLLDAINNSNVFANTLCTALKPNVTPAMIDAIKVPFLRQLAMALYEGTYRTDYRVAEFEAYEPISTLSSRLKTNTYNRYENPTGIYFKSGETVPVFVDGIADGYSVSLIVKDFGSGGQESSVSLANGLNFVSINHNGNGYVSYYNSNWQNAPKVSIHFARGNINGYFDAQRGDDNNYWQQLLANACSEIMDFRTQRLQGAFPVERFRQYCPVKAVELAECWDNLIYREREIMGLQLFNIEPKNRQFARVVWSGFMFADGIGAAAHDNSVEGWINPDNFGWWGMAHELGHVNQVRPSLNWAGCGETTNNIYSAWVEFTLGTSHRLEGEVTGIDDYSHTKGGRFQAYLDQGVRQGIPWQRQEGPDYFGSASEEVSVYSQDYDGNIGAKVTTKTRNYDHFVKVCPLWQLQLYGSYCGFAPDIYGKTINALRSASDANMTTGKQQLRFMRTVCDETGLNFLPFFEKAGMLKPVEIYVSDYGSNWLMISQAMIDDLKNYVAQKGYPTPEGEVNYISALNWQCYAERRPVTGPDQVGRGCSVAGSNKIKVPHSTWHNAVAFETYDASGNLLRITMAGLGSDDSNSYTTVLFPSGSSYIMAVGWDGTRIKCYQGK